MALKSIKPSELTSSAQKSILSSWTIKESHTTTVFYTPQKPPASLNSAKNNVKFVKEGTKDNLLI